MADGFMQFKGASPSLAGSRVIVSGQTADALAFEGRRLARLGHLQQAARCFERAIEVAPEQADFHFQLSLCWWGLGGMDQAGACLARCVRMNPRHALAQAALAEWYLGQGMADSALESVQIALELKPGNRDIALSRGWILEAAGELEEAWTVAKGLVEAGALSGPLLRLYGRLARFKGAQAHALSLIEGALLSGALPRAECAGLAFTAAQLLDSIGRYDEAFARARLGNELRGVAYDPRRHREAVDRIISYFTVERLSHLSRAHQHDAAPVFIVGMPRSGTSLVEQILASHSQVYGAGEVDHIFRAYAGLLAMLGATEARYPECLSQLTADQAQGLAETSFLPLKAFAKGARYVTDKMPLNFLHLGLIALLFPKATIVHCQRNAMDTCLSCYMTDFNSGNAFKYRLEHLGAFYREYERLMEHWKAVLPLRTIEMKYEAVTADVETEARRLISFLDLPWQAGCLEFHNTRRGVATSSVVQVRQPIYQTSVGRAQHYARHLLQLSTVLMS